MSVPFAIQALSRISDLSQRRIGAAGEAHKGSGAHLLTWFIATFDVTAPPNDAAQQDGKPDHDPADHLFLLDMKVGR
jgi:hypothetical protein